MPNTGDATTDSTGGILQAAVGAYVHSSPGPNLREWLAMAEAAYLTERQRPQQGSLLPATESAPPVRATGWASGAWDLYFDAFWAAYPRKAGKLDARKAWQQARRSGATPADVVAAARRYAEDPNREDAYTAHPATWLRAGRWDDPPLPPRGGAPRAQVSGTLDTLAELGRAGRANYDALPGGARGRS
jgi:hypothetical protein